ncbi:MAG: hypothetical protein IBX69_11200 [Anaerolineales bacterium]|nr:hypothetical protein [Anaerolineales bacterium]
MKLEKRTWRNLGITLLVVSIFSLAVPLIYLSFFVEAAPVEVSEPSQDIGTPHDAYEVCKYNISQILVYPEEAVFPILADVNVQNHEPNLFKANSVVQTLNQDREVEPTIFRCSVLYMGDDLWRLETLDLSH